MQDRDVIKVTTLGGSKMTEKAMTEQIGDSLRIAPAFVASIVSDESGIETTLEAQYHREEGRYVVTSILNNAVRDDFDPEALRRTAVSPILQTAVPWCMAIDLERWITVGDLTEGEGRMIPDYMAREVVKRGAGQVRMEVIQIIYGAAALAGLPPVKAVQREIEVPHRTASDWIMRARKDGWLEGMNYAVGRQAEG
ncbi:hypothetical protein RS82_01117 [Microbacterium trichothecenolyticum]|uniref:Uncharacterized protein n=1 Tax=Microbacterium trichothecenolyticum TaxID=69370 RepID=A0A0M2HIM8_MICTR|nr:hypothetical protein RS82_01117 [Microbacterium trichothecenolyticum]